MPIKHAALIAAALFTAMTGFGHPASAQSPSDEPQELGELERAAVLNNYALRLRRYNGAIVAILGQTASGKSNRRDSLLHPSMRS